MSDAKSLCRTALLALVASTVAAVPGARADICKQAGPLAQSKCTKDSQCCPGLVCQAPPGPNKNNATAQCMPGCRIGGAFQMPLQKNTAPNNCQSCQPSKSTTAWSNVAVGTPCRASAGVCDTAESCTGTSGACPADAKSTAQCRASTGVCDSAESCDGVNNDCPPDGLADSTTTCRAAVDADCDFAENCTGTSAACPPDVVQPDGTLCDSGANTCDTGQCCDGASCALCASQCDVFLQTCLDSCSDEVCAKQCIGLLIGCMRSCEVNSNCPSGCPTTTTTSSTTTTSTTTTTTTMPCFVCPPQDSAGFPLGFMTGSSDQLGCFYPNEQHACLYGNGGLIVDGDGGSCPPNAVNTCS